MECFRHGVQNKWNVSKILPSNENTSIIVTLSLQSFSHQFIIDHTTTWHDLMFTDSWEDYV